MKFILSLNAVVLIKGLDIINLRLKKVDKNLDDLDKVLQNLENKKDFVEELDNSGEDPRMEIKEVSMLFQAGLGSQIL